MQALMIANEKWTIIITILFMMYIKRELVNQNNILVQA